MKTPLLSLLMAAAFTTACAPSLDTGCASDEDCPAGRQCAAGRCVGETVTADAGAGGTREDAAAGGSSGGAGGTGGSSGGAGGASGGAGGASGGTGGAGGMPCVPGAAGSDTEICNGIDDDCDGTIDHDNAGAPLAEPCYTGAPGTEGVGPCHAGARVCVDGAWGACLAEVVPADEACDGVDNDCDLQVDDAPTGGPLTVTCYSGPPELQGVGQCHAGARTCMQGLLGECQGESLPGLEICDGVDNDCSGAVDDVEESGDDCSACMPGVSRDCYTGADGTSGVGACRVGQQACREDGSGWSRCEGEIVPQAEESCNGVDDDCDGSVDVGVPGLGGDCPRGIGACETTGTLTCTDGRPTCEGAEFTPIDEICNRVDDDCDGQTDEDFAVGAPCDEGVGACGASGHLECGAGGVVCNAAVGNPEEEDCNGEDDDCDGRADESDGADVLTGSCYGGAFETEGVGACRPGTRICGNDGVWGTCLGEVQPGVEVCDGADNDCNGRIDDGVVGGCGCDAGQRRDCYTGPARTQGVGACHGGTQACVGGAFGACEGEVVPTAEVCNAVDDDCDGDVDDAAHVGEVCISGVGACATVGTRRCMPNTPEPACNAVPDEASLELCNHIDDNCDGVVDDGFDLGAACVSGVGACARRGVRACDADLGASCNAAPLPPGVETCDGIDNDCDGETDEGEVAATCPIVSDTTAACIRGACVYTCNERFFDTDGNPANGCERGCGAPPAGGLVQNLELRTGAERYDADLAVTVNAQGNAAVVYSQAGGNLGGTELVMYTDRGIGLGGDGETIFGPPAAASIGDRFVTIASSGVIGPVDDPRWVGRSVGPDGRGGWDTQANFWERQTSVLPAAATATAGDVQHALFATLDDAPDGNGTLGRLRLRVMNVATGQSIDEPLVGAEVDYFLREARLAAAAIPTGAVIVAQFRDQAMQSRLRLTFVHPNGTFRSLALLNGTWAQPTSEVQAAVLGDALLVGIIDRGAGTLRTWVVSPVGGVGGAFARQAAVVPVSPVAQLSLVTTPNGFIAFVNEANNMRAVFIDPLGVVQGQVADAVSPPVGQRLLFARAASNGRDIRAAWVHAGDQVPVTTLRWAPLECR